MRQCLCCITVTVHKLCLHLKASCPRSPYKPERRRRTLSLQLCMQLVFVSQINRDCLHPSLFFGSLHLSTQICTVRYPTPAPPPQCHNPLSIHTVALHHHSTTSQWKTSRAVIPPLRISLTAPKTDIRVTHTCRRKHHLVRMEYRPGNRRPHVTLGLIRAAEGRRLKGGEDVAVDVEDAEAVAVGSAVLRLVSVTSR